MEKEFTKKQLPQIAEEILRACPGKILLFSGPMGAGKTALIKAMLKVLGGEDAGSSPSFGIVNEYHRKDGSLLAYHFDFYRIREATEALDLGLDDYLDQPVWIFIEWPEKIIPYLPEGGIPIGLEILDSKSRKLRMPD